MYACSTLIEHVFCFLKSTAGQALSLSYGRFFAEFLEDLSLVRLSLLDSTTCVGLRYGTTMLNPNEVFLGSVLLSFAWP
jgi:hypothetical protein